MAKGSTKGGGRGRAPPGRAREQNDADEAMEDSQAEIDDLTAAVDAGGSAGAAAPPSSTLPAGLLQRRLEKETREKEKALQEKEAMQKKLDEMRAELELSKAKVGDVVQVPQNTASQVTPARKVRLLLPETASSFKFRCVRDIPDYS